MALLTTAIAVGAGAKIVGSVLGHNSEKARARAERAAYRAQAQSLLKQSDAYLNAASMQAGNASLIAGTAEHALKLGRANAKAERLLASRIQPIEDIELQRVNKERRQKVGAGRAAFAANGVLVDSGAAARWELDEAMDAAVEKIMVMQAAEDRAFNHLSNAQRRLTEGFSGAANTYAQAAGAYGAAAQTAASGFSSALSAMNAYRSASAVRGPSALGTALAVAGIAADAGTAYYLHSTRA